MTNRAAKVVAWVCALAAVAEGIVLVWPDPAEALRACEASVDELADGVYECAVSLEAANARCTSTAEAAMIRATQLFDCTEEICQANGWEPPWGWGRPMETWGTP